MSNNNFIYNSNQKHFEIPPDDPSWSKSLKEYEHNKTHLHWGNNPKPRYFTHHDNYERELNINPLLQKYSDSSFDNEVSQHEHQTLKKSLSQFYDNSLRYQQTYDIINLSDKFKGFESHPDYPFPKTIPQDKINPSLTNTRSYNILSNKSLYEHNNIPYEKRPTKDYDMPSIKNISVKATNYKDYNILSNQYKENNAEKEQLDKQIACLAAAQKINKRRDFDFLQNKYVSPQLQEEIENKEKYKQENKNVIPYKGQLYNPINMNVYDKDNLLIKDSREYNRINRYRIRPQIDNYYRRKDFENNLRKEERNSHRVDYKKYIVNDKRGYDMFTFGDTYNYYKDHFKFKNDLTCWDLIKEGKGENETITKKGIYKDKYDKSDIDDNIYRFKNNRSTELNKLKPLSEEEKFHVNRSYSKITKDVNEQQNNNIIYPKNIEFNKDKWFSVNKNVHM